MTLFVPFIVSSKVQFVWYSLTRICSYWLWEMGYHHDFNLKFKCDVISLMNPSNMPYLNQVIDDHNDKWSVIFKYSPLYWDDINLITLWDDDDVITVYPRAICDDIRTFIEYESLAIHVLNHVDRIMCHIFWIQPGSSWFESVGL